MFRLFISIFIRFIFIKVFKDFIGFKLVFVVFGVLRFFVLEDEIVDMIISEFSSFLEILSDVDV